MATSDRLDFTPPPPPGFLRGMGLALLAHALLVVALTYGLRWTRDAQPVSAEAELWSAVPQEAAPKATPAPAPPPEPPRPAPPVVRAPPEPDPQLQRDAEIALEREKKQREAAERRQEELERERDQRRKLEAQKKREEELEKKKEQQAKVAAEKRKQEEILQRKKEEELKRKQEQEARRVAQLREENLRRMQAQAGSGAPGATGSATQSSGPSSSWAGRVQARVRPNIVFTDDFSGNPKAEVEVRMAPDGTIVGKRLVKSSGVKSWDDAVLRALDKTETLPRDVDGRVHSPVVIEFRPRG